MLQSSSRYNQRLTQSKEPRKIVSAQKKCRSLDKIVEIPLELLSREGISTHYSESFYRTSQKLVGKRKIIKLGWRVMELAFEQVDLALFCLAMLQAKLTVPIKFYAKTREEEGKRGNDIFRDIWIEWSIIEDKDKQITRGFQISVYKVCLQQVIPKIKGFINKYITWSYMCRQEYEDKKVVKKFQREVVVPLQIRLREFRPTKNFKI